MNDIDAVMWRYATLKPGSRTEDIMDILSEDEKSNVFNNEAFDENAIENNNNTVYVH